MCSEVQINVDWTPTHTHKISHQEVTKILNEEFAKEKYGNQKNIQYKDIYMDSGGKRRNYYVKNQRREWVINLCDILVDRIK
jgi:predicted NACHT family NTPase